MIDIPMFGPWVTEHEVETVVDAMRNGWYEHAYDYVEKFEAEFAGYHDRRYALMTPNCTSAIHLLLMSLGVGEGDEVIVPECTWIATAAPVSYVRATPVFCDIDRESWCLDPASLEAAVTPRTKAVIAVDLYGNMPDIDRISEIAHEMGIAFIEDSAGALGSTYRGVRAGKFGVGSVFSFHRTKTITTGEGGILLTDDPAIFSRSKFLRDHGRVEGKAYYNSEVAYKYMPSNLQAALGHAQFQRLGELVERKRQIFYAYRERLADIRDIELNAEPAHVRNCFWASTLVIGSSHHMTKAKAIEGLEEMGLPGRPFFYPLSSLPAYPEHEGMGRQRNPVAYDISERGINLPSAFNVTEQDIDRVCDGIRKLLA